MGSMGRYKNYRGDVTWEHIGSLAYCPRHIKGSFNCSRASLYTLEYGPSQVGGYFNCVGNYLTTLEFAPRYIKSNFVCDSNQLTNLHNIHRYVNYIGGFFRGCYNEITHSVLGLCLINGLQLVNLGNYPPYDTINSIFNKYLQQYELTKESRMLLVQDALIDAGFEDFAKL